MKIEQIITINLTGEEKEILEKAIKVLDSIDIQLERLNVKTATVFNKDDYQNLANIAFDALTEFLVYMED